MKHKILFTFLFVLSVSLSACSKNSNSFSSDSSISSNESSVYSFDSKEPGITLEDLNAEISGLETLNARKVRYTYHIVEKLSGTYYKTMLDGSEMKEGEYVADLVTEPKNNSNDTNIKLISGNPTTEIQRFFATSYTSAINVKGWLSYQATRRQFLDKAQEGEGFEERFYINPITLYMRIWGRKPANAGIDGDYFGLEEYERVYNTEGYCVSLYIKEYTYMKGTLSSFNNEPRYYNGSYEYTLNCAIEYLD